MHSIYGMVSVIAQVSFSIAALASMHWSLLAACLLAAALIIYAPKLFSRKVGRLSEQCAKEQVQAMSRLKDLLAGIDVLRFFSRTERFIDGNRKASEQIENPRHQLNYTRAFIDEGISVVNLLRQMSVNGLLGVLSIQGVIIQSALMGGENLCGTVYSGLATLGELYVAIHASKPYFQKISAHAECKEPGMLSAIAPVKESIKLERMSAFNMAHSLF